MPSVLCFVIEIDLIHSFLNFDVCFMFIPIFYSLIVMTYISVKS